MTAQIYNNITTSLVRPVQVGDTDIEVADGSKFPPIDAGDYIPIYVYPEGGAHEIMHVTAISGDTLSVNRAQEGTVALLFGGAETVQVRPTRQSLGESDASQMAASTSTGSQTVAEALDRRVIYVDTIADLQALDSSGLVDGQVVYVKEYHAGTGVGGGDFYWDANSTDTEDGGIIIGSHTSGRWRRTYDNTGIFLVDWGVVPDDIAADESNYSAYKKFYDWASINLTKGESASLPSGFVYSTHPLVANGFILTGSHESPSRETEVYLTQQNASDILTTEDVGQWGIIDYSTVVAPCIVGSAYYSGVKNVRLRASSGVQCTHTLFGGVARYHEYNNLSLYAGSNIAFESQGGFLTEYGDMEIRNAVNGVKIGPGPNIVGGNSPSVGKLWINGTSGYGFYSYNMTELHASRLYFEGCTGGPLVYLRTAHNFIIDSLNVDGCEISQDAVFKGRGSTGVVVGCYLESVTSPNNSPFIGEDGANSQVTFEHVRFRNLDGGGLITAKNLRPGEFSEYKINKYTGSPLINGLSSNNVDSNTLFSTSVRRSFEISLADEDITDVVLATVKAPLSNIAIDVEITGASNSTGGFIGTEKTTVYIDASGNVVSDRYVYSDNGGTSSGIAVTTRVPVDAPDFVEIIGSRFNTSYSKYVVNVIANGRGVHFLTNTFY